MFEKERRWEVEDWEIENGGNILTFVDWGRKLFNLLEMKNHW